MLNLIQKHKMFLLTLLALITMLIGFFFVGNEIKTDDSNAAWFEYTHKSSATWKNPTSTNASSGKYKNTSGDEFNVSVGSINYTLNDWKGAELTGTTSTNTLTSTDANCVVEDDNGGGWWINVGHILTCTVTPISGFTSDKATETWNREFNVDASYYKTITYNVIFSPIQYDITYNASANGGSLSNSAQSTIKTYFYERYTLPSVQARTGYTFAGWYTAASGGTKITSTTCFTNVDTTTLYAHWTANTYTLTFDNQGGSANSSKSVTYDGALPTITKPTKTGYTFRGYYTGALGTGTQYYDNNLTKKVSPYRTASNLTLYACWSANTYTVTFNQNGGSGGTSSVTATYDSAMPSITKPKRTGYSFLGYYDTSAETGGTQYYTAAGVSGKNWDKTSDTTLYARWAVEKYTIVLKDVDGTGLGTIYNLQYQSTLLPIAPPTKTGYTFQGYYTVENGNTGGDKVFDSSGNSVTGTGYFNSDKKWIKDLSPDSEGTASLNLYAHWTANIYTVILNKNGGSGGTSTVTATYDSAMPSITAPSRTGYTFQGYYTAASGGTKYYNANGTSAKKWDKTSNTTLYAHWEKNSYKVIFDQNGGSGGTTEVTATYDKAMPTVTPPTRTGYYFAGYFDSKTGGTQYYYADGVSYRTWNKTTATTLYAHWEDTWLNHVAVPTGAGSETSPYLISTPQNLAWIARQTENGNNFDSLYFKQTANIDLNNYVWYPIGSNAHRFAGNYDGNNFIINNLHTTQIKKSNGEYPYSYQGLFGYTHGASVSNINMFNANVYGDDMVGGIAGVTYNTKVEGCHYYGNVYGSWNVGGLIGRAYGNNTDSSLKNCYANGSVTAVGCSGGLVGVIGINISNCGFDGAITTNTSTSSLDGNRRALFVGQSIADCIIENCFVYSSTATKPYLYTQGIRENADSTVTTFEITMKYCLFSIYPESGKKESYAVHDSEDEVAKPEWGSWTRFNGIPMPEGLLWVRDYALLFTVDIEEFTYITKVNIASYYITRSSEI